MHECIRRLLQHTGDEEALECFAKLMFTIGKDLDHEKGHVIVFIFVYQIISVLLPGSNTTVHGQSRLNYQSWENFVSYKVLFTRCSRAKKCVCMCGCVNVCMQYALGNKYLESKFACVFVLCTVDFR